MPEKDKLDPKGTPNITPEIKQVVEDNLNPDVNKKENNVSKENEDFFKKLNEKKAKIQEEETFAKGSLTGVTAAGQRTAKTPEGYHGKLHEEIGIDLFTTPDNWEKLGYSEQSAIDVGLNAFSGFVTNVAAGFIEGVAGNDPASLFNMAMGNTEQRYGNILNEWAASLLEGSDKNFHIYDGGNNSPFSYTYWGKQLQTFGYSVGIIGEMFAEAALLRKVSASSLGAIGKGAKALSHPATFGSFQGIKEAYLNGLQTGEQVFHKYKDMGYSEEEAKKKGKEAATLGFRMEAIPLMTMNAIQFATLSKFNPFSKKASGPNLGFSGAFETLAQGAFKNVKNPYIGKIADYGLNIASEAIEEGIQTGVGKLAEYKLGYADGLVSKKSLDDILFDDDEMRDTMIGGALGGGIFRFMGKRVNKLTNGTQLKIQAQDYDNYLAGVAKRVQLDTADLQEALDNNDQEKANIIRKRMQRNSVFEALQFDLMNQDEKGFDTYMSTLNNMKDAIKNEDINAMKEYGITEPQDVESVKNNIDMYIADANNIKGKLIDALQTTDDYHAAIEIANAQKTLEELKEYDDRSGAAINDILAKDKAYQSLTETGKQKFDLLAEKASLEAKAKNGSPITFAQKDRINDIKNELKELEETNKKYDGKEKDNSTIDTIDATGILKERINQYEMRDTFDIVAEKLKKLTNKKEQKKARKKRAKKKISKAKKAESLKKAKEDLQKDGNLTPDVEDKVDAKIAQAEIKESANNGQIDEPFSSFRKPTKKKSPKKPEQPEAPAPTQAPPVQDEVLPENPFGQVVTEDFVVDEIPPSQERSDTASDIIDALRDDQDNNDDAGGAIIVDDHDSLFMPAMVGEYSESQINKLKELVGNYYDSLKFDLGRSPKFEDFIRDFIKNNTKEDTEKIFYALVEGWKANNYAKADYNAVYNSVFRDRKAMTSDILNAAEDIIVPDSKEKVHRNNENNAQKAIDEKSPTVELDENNRPKVRDNNAFRTVSPELKAQHLSIPYTRKITEINGEQVVVDEDASKYLNEATDINSKKLLNPNAYQPGTKLTVKIPENYKDIKIQTWVDDFTAGPVMSYGEWEANNGGVRDRNNIPMVAVDQDGDAVFFIPSTGWYNAINVGYKDDIQKQSEVIQEARKNLSEFRDNVIINNGVEIEITSKRPGTMKTIDNDEAPIPLSQADPTSSIAIAKSAQELFVNGRNFLEGGNKELMNVEFFDKGHTYEIRQAEGNQYMALKVLRENLNEDVQSSLNKAVELYLTQFDKHGQLGNIETNKRIRTEVKRQTGLDLHKREDFEKYLNLFIPTLKGSFSGTLDIANYVNANNSLPHGTPFVAIQKGSLVFGIKGQQLLKGKDVLYLHPRKINDPDGINLVRNVLRSFTENLTSRFTQNINEAGLVRNIPVALINSEGSVTSDQKYREYLKDSLKTNVRAYNVGTEAKPIYSSFLQPVINFKMSGPVSDFDKKSEIANKIRNDEILTKEETTIAQDNAEEINEQLSDQVTPVVPDEVSTLMATLASLKEANVPKSDPSIQYILSRLEELDQNADYAPVIVDDAMVQTMRDSIEDLSGVSILQDFQLVDFIFNEVVTKLDFKYKSAIDKAKILKEIKSSYLALIEPKRLNDLKTLDNVKNLHALAPSDNTANLVKSMEDKMAIYETVEKDWKLFENKALQKISKYTGIKESKMEIKNLEDDSTQLEKNYSKTSLEENGKTSSSYRLKRFFSGIKQVNKNNEPIKGFLGVNTYVGFDKVYETITAILASPIETDSNYEHFLLKFEENYEAHPWLRQVVEELNAADQQIRNELLYEMAKHSLTMKFMMFSKERSGRYSLKTFDTNANEITRVIRQQWNSNLLTSDLVVEENGVNKINKIKAKEMLTKFYDWTLHIAKNRGNLKTASTINIPNSEISNWLADFGIVISDETINELKSTNNEFTTSKGKVKTTFAELFDKGANSYGIFGNLADYLEKIIATEDTSFDEKPANHPFDNAKNLLKMLALKESKYNSYVSPNAFRDGDKSIYGFTPSKHATDTSKKLRFDQDFRDQLLEKSFNKHSYMLDKLNTDEVFAGKFNVEHLGITAMKELGKKVFGDNNAITSLSDIDHELTKVGFFQDTKQGQVSGSLGYENFVDFRMGRMFMPTMSDKSQMLLMNTAVLDLKEKHFTISEDNTVTLKPELVDIIYTQMVKPELERMYNFSSNVKSTDIKGYDTAAQMFTMIPEMNNLIDEKTGHRAIGLMAEAPQKYDMDWFEQSFGDKIKTIINKVVQNEVDNKLKVWEDSDFFDPKTGLTQFLDEDYLDSRTTDNTHPLTKVKVAANDFVINSLLTNANTYMMFIGDPALYSQNKIKKYFQDGKPYLPKKKYGTKAYAMAIKDVLGVNLGKRLALMLAPGRKLANSKGQDYVQIFLNDHIDMTSNVSFLVDLFYTPEDVKYAKKQVEKYNKAKTSEEKADIAETLSNRYPEISDYFEIEATDAQEYTTASEHIDVLFAQGRLTEDQYNTITNKIQNQLKSERKGEAINKADMLNYNELSVVLQPVKPVHTGFKNEPSLDAMRMMYVKSSSFPLLPQVTKGTELDKLRRTMEEFEHTKGKRIRASYQSANKVGATTSAITPFNPDGTFNDKIDNQALEDGSLVLSRENFRIQQDVPFKSSKRKEDRVALGTQTLKLLFGDGVTALKGFKLDGKEYTGLELKNEFNRIFVDYLASKKKSLYKKLGLNEDGTTDDNKKVMEGLQKLLKREAEERGFSKQDIEALKLTTDESGNIDFNTPLWLSPNSNRYESLLNAIVTNKLVNIKVPGNSFVVGSEAGFKMTNDMQGIDQSRIVFTPSFDGELKAAEFNKDGSLKKAQIMVPSKFRDNDGNLIELIDANGDINENYVTKEENGRLVLKEGAIANELLNITSFRIPTSGHVSMSQLDIAGILPTEVGDLMIVPRNLTKQKGLDFDVDKETTYQLHTFINQETGAIEVLNEDHRQAILKAADAKNTAEWNDDSAESKLLRAIFGEDPDFILEEIEENSKLDKINDLMDQKLMENQFVKIHNSVLGSSNRTVQQKINKVLSMDFAKSQAELVQKALESSVDNTYFTMLSDEYQKGKMALGASGKLGIGVYSNYVTFHSMIQQADKPISLTKLDGKGNKVPYQVTIGNYTSDGVLGRQNSLGIYSRSISEAFAERQNTATDNEKEQIMGRLNINEVTINVDSLLTALGFDKAKLEDGTEVSIPYLLMSQPIIKKYVEGMRKTKSNTKEYDPTAEENLINELTGNADLAELRHYRKALTAQNLYSGLTNVDPVLQNVALDLFLDLKGKAKELSEIQSRLNINNEGLGKSFFDVIDKHDSINKFQYYSVKGIEQLVGDFKDAREMTQLEKDEAIANGGIIIGNDIVTPKTPVGAILINAVEAGYNLWKDFFPYGDHNIQNAFHAILPNISTEETSYKKIVQLKQDIFKEMKKYFVSSQKLGLFNEDPQKLREELFLDRGKHQSLATYLNKVTNLTSDDVLILKNNKLLSRFQYQLKKNGLPSLIKFDNTQGENFDEDYLYMSLIELLEANAALPDKNGKAYTTRDLAQELIAYNYLEGGVQEAIQFSKYVPIPYLNAVGFGSTTRNWNDAKVPGIFKSILGGKSAVDLNSRFVKQYLQHNPKRLHKIDPVRDSLIEREYSGKKILANLESFSLPSLEGMPFYVTVYNKKVKKGLKKFQVYALDGATYKRVSTLGTFGMSEYSVKEDNVTSILNPVKKVVREIQPKVTSTASNPAKRANASTPDHFGIMSQTTEEIVKNIANYNFTEYPELKPVANAILPYVNSGLKIKVAKLVNKAGERVARGRFSKGEVIIDSVHLRIGKPEDIAKTVLHEIIHGLTSDYVKQFVDKQGNELTSNTPKEITELIILFNQTKEKLADEVEAYRIKRQEQLGGYTREPSTKREATVVYGGTNIREFITLVLTEKDFQQEMKNTLLPNGTSLWKKFTSAINNLISLILGKDYKANSVTAQGIATSLEIIEKQAKQKANTKRAAMEKNDAAAENLLSENPFGQVTRPSLSDLEEMYKNLDLSDDSPTFENHFKCV
jgi:hypothetical protein